MKDERTLRQTKIAHRHIFNMILIGDYARAARYSLRLTEILQVRQCQKVNSKWDIKVVKQKKLTAV